MPKIKDQLKDEKLVLDPNDYPDYGDYLAAKKAAEAKAEAEKEK